MINFDDYTNENKIEQIQIGHRFQIIHGEYLLQVVLDQENKCIIKFNK